MTWEIVLVRSRVNSAGTTVEWPEQLRAPGVCVRSLGGQNPLARLLDRMTTAKRIWGIRGTAFIQHRIAKWMRSVGPTSWKAYCGEIGSWIEYFVRKNRFDVVYFSWPYYMEPPQLRVPMVATPHDFIFKHGLTVHPDWQKKLDSQMARWLERCSQVVVSSNFVASELKAFYPAWAHKTNVVRLGIPSASHAPTLEEADAMCRSHQLPKCFVLTVGWIVEHKNQLVVFEAIAKLRERGFNIGIVSVGPNSKYLNKARREEAGSVSPDSYLTKVVSFCDAAGLREGIDYFGLGYVDDLEVECLYRRAIALVVPTLTEAGSFPAREAMRSGCSVVYADVPVYREEIDLVEGNASTFPAHDASKLADEIVWLIEHEDEVNQLKQKAKDLVSRAYSWSETAKGYFTVFEHAAGCVNK